MAEGGQPQPLGYLLADVARQHRSVRVAPVASTLVSDDTALLMQICADNRLDKLNLRLLAPTVLAIQATTADTMAALRKADYRPASKAPTAATSSRKPAATAPDVLENDDQRSHSVQWRLSRCSPTGSPVRAGATTHHRVPARAP
ncbi:hypothetical protein AB0K35_26220 [Micromonospora sp. NPDC053740]|uniref:hypothetical protein n=1 Tax=Micromonospora sp. NPDC053740 TaxID=3155173 RepID=UPI0034223F63